MTGKITLLNGADSSGFILAESGAHVHFKSSDLFAYDIGRIAVGQVVTFDLKAGHLAEAINVCPQRSGTATDGKAHLRRPDGYMRYVGFDHKGNLRCYRFEFTSPGQEMQAIVFQIDLGLLTKHHLAIQDGPNLCRHVLAAQHIDSGSSVVRMREFLLTDLDISAYQQSLPLSSSKSRSGFRKSSTAGASHA